MSAPPRANLSNLYAVWNRKYIGSKDTIKWTDEDRQNAMETGFHTLQLLVPVISTTFASVGRFLKDIKTPGSLGMLIIDEAGQAEPQKALGALLRCRSAIIVGDPKQIPPVVTDDMDLLRNAYTDKLLDPYKDKTNSVQRNADFINPLGSYLGEDDPEPEDWVGSPLVVHRRCVSPMFEIANEISYGGMMKQQTKNEEAEEAERFIRKESQWIQVEGSEAGNRDHFVREQGDKVIELLEESIRKNREPDQAIVMPNLYIISPFITNVRGIEHHLDRYYEEHQDDINSLLVKVEKDELKKWLYQNIGTVHKFQGKEAPEVIFLLGCDETSLPAVRWVSDNIVNVAATRAKKRFYVIGDAEVWKESECVSQMKQIMDGQMEQSE